MAKEIEKKEKIEKEPKTENSKKVLALSSKTEQKKKKEFEAIMNIYTSFNNTIVHVTDMSGRTIVKVSGGMVTKHGRLKANPTIAMFISKRISGNFVTKSGKIFSTEFLYFSATVDFPKPGYYEVWARATGSDGIAQPMILPGWNPKGYLNNACHRIAVKVK
jgi:hypothetical protein